MYMSIYITDPDDGKVHDRAPQGVSETKCGKDIREVKRFDGIRKSFPSEQICLTCFPFMKKEKR